MMKRGSKLIVLFLLLAIAAASFTGCGNPGSTGETSKPVNTTEASASDKQVETAAPEIDVTIWDENMGGTLPLDKDHPLYKYYKDMIGVGVLKPNVDWSNYSNLLNMRIAAGEMPDAFLPVNSMEVNLVKTEGLADLTDLLPKYAPNLYQRVPQDTWAAIKAMDPNEEGRNYFIPQIADYNIYGGMIRKDWLDNLGLSVPETQDEFVNVLKAFRDKDPNGNGKNDELPTSGRENATWLDPLFYMYGVSINPGSTPVWDIYDGQLTFSAVTPNMKAALQFISMLYKEKLLDNESFLNKKDTWDAKVKSNRVGVWGSLPEGVSSRIVEMQKTNPKANVVALPVIKVDGYDGYIARKNLGRINYVLKKQSEDRVIAALKVLDFAADQNNIQKLKLISTKEGGIIGDTVQIPLSFPFLTYTYIINLNDKINELNYAADKDPVKKPAYDMSIQAMKDIQAFGRVVASNGMSDTIYGDNTDLQTHKLYIDYATRIIVGEYPISKFDEFVEKWNKSGGEQATINARAWYSKVKK